MQDNDDTTEETEMAVKANARKAPCTDCKPMVRRIKAGQDGTQWWWCYGCGEWEFVGGVVKRPEGWR